MSRRGLLACFAGWCNPRADMTRIAPTLMRYLTVLALLVAFATAGLSHRAASQLPDPDLVAYVQAGGVLSDICGDADGGAHPGASTCEACRLVGVAVLPEWAGISGPAFTPREIGNRPVRRLAAALVGFEFSRTARGPPAT